MIEEERNPWKTIDELIELKQPFAVYRLPGEKSICLLIGEVESLQYIYDLKDLNNQKGFVIAPFNVDQSCPIVLLQPEKEIFFYLDEVSESEDLINRTYLEESFSGDCSEAYASCFSKFIQALREETFDKLVLSRSWTVSKKSVFSSVSVLRAACRQYKHSYIYLCYTPQTGMWLGSTPEIILSGESNWWNTVALAGTQPLFNGALPLEWDDKNRQEQEYVAAYVRHQLFLLDIHPEEKGPYPSYAGALSHLKTDFHFSLDESEKLGDLLKVLHPTPAVCGLPKEEAYRFILENERYERSYYSGFIGWIDPKGKTDLYVNLRCMHIDDTSLTLYAGGGLLASSELKDEWQETEKKMQTMRRLLLSGLRNNEL